MKNILFKKALMDIFRRKLRSALVILGITFGVAGLTAVNIANQSVYDALNYSANEAHAPNITVYAKTLTTDDLAAVQQLSNIKTAQLVYRYSTQWQTTSGNNVPLTIIAYDNLQQIAMNPFQLTSGQLPGNHQIALESSDNGLAPFVIHGNISVSIQQSKAVIQVSGTTRTLGQTSAVISNAALGYMNQTGFTDLTGITTPNILYISINDIHQLNDTAVHVNTLLESRHVKITGISFTENSFSAGPLPGIFSILRVISIVALIVTAFLIINMISILILEQTPIIGLMKAIGGTRNTILLGYSFTVLLYAIVGTLLGIVLGLWGGYAFTAFIASLIILDLGPFHLAAASILIAGLVGILTPLLAALVPLYTGTATTVRAAIQQFSLAGDAARQTLLSKSTQNIPQTIRLGLLSVMRRRGRFLLTLIALGVSGASFFTVQTASNSIDISLQRYFSSYNYDVSLNINSAQSIQSFKQSMAGIPNVGSIEPVESDTVPSHWGSIRIQAYQYDTQMFRYQLTDGSWFTTDNTSATVISDVLAKITHLTVGNTITTTILGHTKTWDIIGIAHDYSNEFGMAGSMYVTFTGLAAFNHVDATQSSWYFVQAIDRSPAAIQSLTQAVNAQLNAQGLNPSTTTLQQQIQRNTSQFQILFAILYGAAAIIAIVGMLGLANTLTTSVIDRRREIGIMRSLGGKGRQIALIFVTEGLFFAVVGWFAGIILGAIGSPQFVSFMSNALSLPIQLTYSPLAILVSFGAVVIIGIIAAIGPSVIASRMRIAEILRYE